MPAEVGRAARSHSVQSLRSSEELGRYFRTPQWKAETCLVNKLVRGEPAA